MFNKIIELGNERKINLFQDYASHLQNFKDLWKSNPIFLTKKLYVGEFFVNSALPKR